MTVSIDAAGLALIRGHGEAGYPHEVCGFLLGEMDAAAPRFEVFEVRPSVNRRADESERRYRIDPEDYRTAEGQAAERGWDVVGIYHSHPDVPARPSDYDREHAWPNSAYLIVAVEGGVAGLVTAWLLAEDRSAFNELGIAGVAETAG